MKYRHPASRFCLRWLCLMSVLLLCAAASKAQDGDKLRNYHLTRHSFSFGVGLVSENKQLENDFFTEGTFGDLYNVLRYSYGDLVTTGSLNLGYTYYANRHVAFGLSASFQHDRRLIYRVGREQQIGDTKQVFAYLTPRIIFFWHTSYPFRFYSAAAVSAGRSWRSFSLQDGGFSKNEYRLFPQLTPLGVQAGKRIYGFGEINIGGRTGYLNLGIGYRIGKMTRKNINQ